MRSGRRSGRSVGGHRRSGRLPSCSLYNRLHTPAPEYQRRETAWQDRLGPAETNRRLERGQLQPSRVAQA